MFGLQDTARIAVKIILIGIFFAVIYSFISEFNGYLQSLVLQIVSSFSSINGLDLGYFAGAVGLVSFLNNLLQSLFLAGKIFISVVSSLLVFKFVAKMFNTVMRV